MAKPKGSTERLHDHLRPLQVSHQRKWSQHLSELVAVYNSTPHISTGCNLHYLIYGRESNDVLLNINEDGDRENSVSEWLQRRLRDAHVRADEQLKRNEISC